MLIPGTKHIDPDTGLIYFKYDFGYEFGIIFPGEGKKIVGGVRNEGPVVKRSLPIRSGDIELPVYHEKTLNGNGIEAHYDEPSSQSKKRYSLPIEISVDEFHRNDQTSSKTVEGICYL